MATKDYEGRISFIQTKLKQEEKRKKKEPKVKKVVKTMSMYYSALVNDWQGVAYLYYVLSYNNLIIARHMITDAGYNSEKAMVDAIKASKFQMLCTLLEKYKCGKTMLISLAQHGTAEDWLLPIARKLIKHVKVDEKDEHGWYVVFVLCFAYIIRSSALHYAAMNQRLELSKYLLKKGANANQEDKDQRIPLHCAVQSKGDQANQLKIVELLVEKSKKVPQFIGSII